MSRILVLFASHFGQTRKIAERIGERLREHGHHVELGDARREIAAPPPEDYDAVVIGSRIETGRHAVEIRNYIASHAVALEEMQTAFFSVSMAASRPNAGTDPNGYMKELFDQQNWHPAHFAAFAGALPYRKYNWFLRFIMKRISLSAGHTTDTSQNHEFTDWARVQSFADEVSSGLPRDQTAQDQLPATVAAPSVR